MRDFELRMLALQLSVQLPSMPKEAHVVARALCDLTENWLLRPLERPDAIFPQRSDNVAIFPRKSGRPAENFEAEKDSENF